METGAVQFIDVYQRPSMPPPAHVRTALHNHAGGDLTVDLRGNTAAGLARAVEGTGITAVWVGPA